MRLSVRNTVWDAGTEVLRTDTIWALGHWTPRERRTRRPRPHCSNQPDGLVPAWLVQPAAVAGQTVHPDLFEYHSNLSGCWRAFSIQFALPNSSSMRSVPDDINETRNALELIT